MNDFRYGLANVNTLFNRLKLNTFLAAVFSNSTYFLFQISTNLIFFFKILVVAVAVAAVAREPLLSDPLLSDPAICQIS